MSFDTIIKSVFVAAVVLTCAAPTRAETPAQQAENRKMMSFYDVGNYNQTIVVAGQILQKDRSNIVVHYILGNSYTKTGAIEKAKQEYLYCQSISKPGDQIYQYCQTALQQLANQAKTAPSPTDAKTSATTPTAPGSGDTTDGAAPPLDRYTTERIKKFHDDGAQAIETRKRALDLQIGIVQQQCNDDCSGIQRVNMQGMLNPFYESDISKIREAANAKIVALSGDFETEKAKITAHFDEEAKKFEESQRARSQAAQPQRH